MDINPFVKLMMYLEGARTSLSFKSLEALMNDAQLYVDQLKAENAQVREALAEHSLYYLDPASNELFDQPLNWEARLLQAIGGE